MTTQVSSTEGAGLRNSILRHVLSGILAVQYPSVDRLRIECSVTRFRVTEVDEDGVETPVDIEWLQSPGPRAETVRSILQQLSERGGIPAEGLTMPLEHLEPYHLAVQRR